MKPTVLYFISFLFVSSLLASCSSNTAATDPLVTSMVDVATNGSTRTSVFTYNGSKVSSIVNEDVSIEFFYLGSLISKTIQTNVATQEQEVIDYVYSNGNLSKIVSSLNYKIYYTHQANGLIDYQKKVVDGLGNETLVLHGTLNIANENLVNDDAEYDDTPINTVKKHKLSYNYDSKRNPLFNITGFKKLLNFGKAISKNNAFRGTEIHSEDYLAINQGISSVVSLVSTFQYNGSHYPQERESNFLLLDYNVAFPDYEKTLYYY